MTTTIHQLGQLKKYIEFLEEYYTNTDSTDLRTDMDAAVKQIEQAIFIINSKVDYSEMILEKLYKAITEFGWNSPNYAYADCSGIYDKLIDIKNRKITGELYIPWSNSPCWYEFICVLENEKIGSPPHTDYRLNIIITPFTDNPKNKYFTEKTSEKYYRCSPFTDFEELLINVFEEYT